MHRLSLFYVVESGRYELATLLCVHRHCHVATGLALAMDTQTEGFCVEAPTKRYCSLSWIPLGRVVAIVRKAHCSMYDFVEEKNRILLPLY